MDPQLDVAGIPDVDPVEVEVGRNDATGFADTSRQPPDDRSAAGADFQTTPAWSHTAAAEMAERRWVKCRLESEESPSSLARRIVEEISLVGQSITSTPQYSGLHTMAA
jgi:hypothetical protein